MLLTSAEEHQSLYEGPKGDDLAPFAPYLVRLPPRSQLLDALVRQAWGHSWGVYLTCDRPFKEVRKHFRHFLFVRTPDDRDLYFRFYDPRVLRVFLPTCTPNELREFFGPVDRFLLEADNPDRLLTFRLDTGPLEQDALPLCPRERTNAMTHSTPSP
jgi:hypothetical protein